MEIIVYILFEILNNYFIYLNLNTLSKKYYIIEYIVYKAKK